MGITNKYEEINNLTFIIIKFFFCFSTVLYENIIPVFIYPHFVLFVNGKPVLSKKPIKYRKKLNFFLKRICIYLFSIIVIIYLE